MNPIRSVLFGVAVGDALGVPVEFKSRQAISKNPVTDMIGYGTYNLPPGT
ncbi:MAG: ADP-ribosylglycohydrolase family protein [Bacteroidales bacterium]|nr:ADP-ribosylglycohydrolase family protein [Bacteroidales bacterium]